MHIDRYEHHGQLVAVRVDDKGKHKDHCLCFAPCKNFHPGDPERNCPIAQDLFEFDKGWGS